MEAFGQQVKQIRKNVLTPQRALISVPRGTRKSTTGMVKIIVNVNFARKNGEKPNEE